MPKCTSLEIVSPTRHTLNNFKNIILVLHLNSVILSRFVKFQHDILQNKRQTPKFATWLYVLLEIYALMIAQMIRANYSLDPSIWYLNMGYIKFENNYMDYYYNQN